MVQEIRMVVVLDSEQKAKVRQGWEHGGDIRKKRDFRAGRKTQNADIGLEEQRMKAVRTRV